MSHVYVTQYDQEFEDKTIILFMLTDKTKREIFKNLQERDNNHRNIVLSCSRAALLGANKVITTKAHCRETPRDKFRR